MNTDQQSSLQLSINQLLAYYGMDSTGMAWNDVTNPGVISVFKPGITLASTGTDWPTTTPSIIQFDNGLYAWLIDATTKQILDPRTQQPVDAIGFGSPLQWWSYTQPVIDVPTLQPTVYVENTVDGIEYHRLQAAPKKMYIKKVGGIFKMDFSGRIITHRDFIGVPNSQKAYGDSVRIMGIAHHPIVPTGQDFLMDMDDWGNFTGTGQVARLQGYILADLSDTPPPPLTVLTPKSPPLPTPTHDAVGVVPVDTRFFHFQYLQADRQPVRYQVMRSVVVQDYSRTGKPQRVLKGRTIKVLGTFQYKARTFLLPVMDDDQLDPFAYWYGIPEVIQDQRIVEEIPDMAELRQPLTTVAEREALHTGSMSDHLVHWASRFEHGFINLFRRNKQ